MKKPYLQGALICERVLEEKDGSLSAIRIVDAVVHRGPSEFTYPVTVLCVVRTDDSETEVPVRIEMESPSGVLATVTSAAVRGRRQNLIMNTTVTFRQSGLHWFNVYVNNTLATKIPFTIISASGDNLKITDSVRGQFS